MTAPASDLPSDFDGQTRLFPLAELVLFPGNALPLHIFESRYVEMLEDAVGDDHLIAMATLLPGHEHEYYGRAPIAQTVCIGKVTEYRKTARGTYNLVLIGLRRARVEYEIEPVRSFRRAKIDLIETLTNRPETDSNLGVQLGNRLVQSMPAVKQLLQHFLEGRVSLASLTDVLAFHVPLATELKLELLAEPSAVTRAETMLAHLPQPKSGDHHRGGPPTNFSDN